jgi:predicted RNase H-like HicB family nuclease
MSKDLAYYRLLPYEREWAMRDEAGQKYFVVRLKDLPAVAGDGSTRDEAADDLREAFDEFVLAWIDAGRPVPGPNRPFTVPTTPAQSPAREWTTSVSQPELNAGAHSNWADSAVLYRNASVEATPAKPRMETELQTAVTG